MLVGSSVSPVLEPATVPHMLMICLTAWPLFAPQSRRHDNSAGEGISSRCLLFLSKGKPRGNNLGREGCECLVILAVAALTALRHGLIRIGPRRFCVTIAKQLY